MPSPMRSPTGLEHGGWQGLRTVPWGSIWTFKRPGWRQSCSTGPKSTQETGPKAGLGASCSVRTRGLSRRHATSSLCQSRRWGRRQGCRQVHLRRSSGKEQRPRPKLNWGYWGVWRVPVRLVGAIKVPSGCWHLQLLGGIDERLLALCAVTSH